MGNDLNIYFRPDNVMLNLSDDVTSKIQEMLNAVHPSQYPWVKRVQGGIVYFVNASPDGTEVISLFEAYTRLILPSVYCGVIDESAKVWYPKQIIISLTAHEPVASLISFNADEVEQGIMNTFLEFKRKQVIYDIRYE